MDRVAAMVLAGGRNEGFGVLTRNRAKAALPYAGHYRLIDFALSNLSDAGVPRVGVIIQYLPGSLLDHVGIGGAWDYDGVQRRLKVMPPFVGVGDTEWFLGSADALRRNLDFIHPERGTDVIVCSGEHVYSIDFAEIIEFHRQRRADLTIVAMREQSARRSIRFGRVEFDPDTLRVRRFEEKPPAPFSDWISIGVYVFRSEALVEGLQGSLDGKMPNNLPKEVVEPISRGQNTWAYVFEGPWEYVQDLGDYYQGHMDLLSGDAKNLHRRLGSPNESPRPAIRRSSAGVLRPFVGSLRLDRIARLPRSRLRH